MTLDKQLVGNYTIKEDDNLLLDYKVGCDIEGLMAKNYPNSKEAELLAKLHKAGENRDIKVCLEVALEIEEIMLLSKVYRDPNGDSSEKIIEEISQFVNEKPHRVFETYGFHYESFLEYANVCLAKSEVPGVNVDVHELEELRYDLFNAPTKELVQKSLKLLGYEETIYRIAMNLFRGGNLAMLYGGFTGWSENNPVTASGLVDAAYKFEEEYKKVINGEGHSEYGLPSKEEWGAETKKREELRLKQIEEEEERNRILALETESAKKGEGFLSRIFGRGR